VRFEWDDRKSASNLKKHGVRFETAARVFTDPWFLMEEDQVVDGEMRWRTLGEVDGETLLLVVHLLGVDEDDEETVRIISAREAAPKERRHYESGLHA
jgi:uncharacterized DUF497 family protein